MESPITLFTVPKASTYSGIPESLLRGAVKNGRIRTIIISKRKLIPLAALTSLLRELHHADEPVTADA